VAWQTDRYRSRLLGTAALLVVVLLAAACGGSGDSQGTGGNGNTNGTAPPLDPDVTIAATGEPQRGGTLIYGIEAESDGYNPTKNRFAPSGTMVGLAIYDPLAAFDENGQPQPYLAESLTPSADFKVWTITARPNITFHNGERLDGEAMRIFFEALRSDQLVGIAFKNIDTVAVDPSNPLAVRITMKEPWATFPVFMTGQGGMVTAPAMANDPNSGRHPVGTGPFVFQEWVTDKAVKATRNPNYWRKDANGEQLPYLDAVEFRPLPDAGTRTSALLSGDINMIHQTDPQQTKRLQDEAAQGRIQLVFDRGEREETFFMLNTSRPPLDDIRVRQALAYATNRDLFNQIIYEGRGEIADGVFSQSSRWRGDGAPYPEYDPAKAQQLVNEYESEKGPIRFSLVAAGTDDRAINLAKEQWAAVGIDVDVSLMEQGQFIANAALGNYQAHAWRQFGALDPDYDYIWWTSENAGEGIALNFARNKDPRIDEALKRGRGTTDIAVRKQAYQDVQRYINEDLPYIWYVRAQWVVAATNDVRGITNGPLPNGTPAIPMGGPGGFGGITFLTQTWLAK
jgi:ABC-type transport system substrate-binding protein